MSSNRSYRVCSLRATRICIIIAATISSMPGCNPMTTRYPTPPLGNSLAERRAFERHDPYPLEDLGPDTFTRPRAYIEPRDEARRAAEQRMLRGMSLEALPPVPATGNTYPNALRN